jgi:L-fucose isomerase-like protein
LEQPTVLVTPVASPIHIERAIEPSERARELLQEAGLKVFGPKKPVTKIEEFPVTVEEYDAIVFFVASGGTSELIKTLMKDKSAILWAYHENNSLPSALSARERLVAIGGWKGTIVYNSLNAAPLEIVAAAQASRLLRSLRGLRIGLIGDEDDFSKASADAEMLKMNFGVEVVYLPFDKLKQEWSHIADRMADSVIKERLVKAEVVEPSQRDLVKSARLYLALKKIIADEKLDTVTLDCFKFLKRTGCTPCLSFACLNDDGFNGVCEADLRASIVALMFRVLTGYPSWVSNLVQIDKTLGTITCAHCTAAMSLSEPGRITRVRTHFESGLSVSLDVPLMRRLATLVNLQIKPLKMTIIVGEVIDSQMGHLTICRTQAKIKPTGDVSRLLEDTGNHHVLAYGDWSATLVQVAKNTGITAVKV